MMMIKIIITTTKEHIAPKGNLSAPKHDPAESDLTG
jgi:hypothetical protein